MTVSVTLRIGDQTLVAELDDKALAAIAAAIEPARAQQGSPYMTISEAAAYLRCSRQRIDDLLSSRRLTRIKEGRRTLVARDEVERWIAQNPARPSFRARRTYTGG